MGIDWMTFTAQIVNLFVLMWLLKRFLYQPVLKIIDERQAKINRKIKDASLLREKAEKERDEYREKAEKLEQEKEDLLVKARKEADELRQKLCKEAEKEAAEKQEKWAQTIEQERKAFEMNLRALFIKSFRCLSEKALREIAETGLKESVIKVFLTKLSELSPEQKAVFKTQNDLTLSGDFTLTESEKEMLTSGICSAVGLDHMPKITFARDENLIIGLDLTAGERTFTWTLNDYFDTFSKEIQKAVTDLSTKEEKKNV